MVTTPDQQYQESKFMDESCSCRHLVPEKSFNYSSDTCQGLKKLPFKWPNELVEPFKDPLKIIFLKTTISKVFTSTSTTAVAFLACSYAPVAEPICANSSTPSRTAALMTKHRPPSVLLQAHLLFLCPSVKLHQAMEHMTLYNIRINKSVVTV